MWHGARLDDPVEDDANDCKTKTPVPEELKSLVTEESGDESPVDGRVRAIRDKAAGSVPSSRALKITNDYYQRKKKSNIDTLWAKSTQPLFSVKFISCTRPLINWGDVGRLALYATHCIYYVSQSGNTCKHPVLTMLYIVSSSWEV